MPAGGIDQSRRHWKVRWVLSARRSSDVQISITLSDDQRKEEKWRYSLGITRETGGERLQVLTHERVWKDNIPFSTDPMKEIKKTSKTNTDQL